MQNLIAQVATLGTTSNAGVNEIFGHLLSATEIALEISRRTFSGENAKSLDLSTSYVVWALGEGNLGLAITATCSAVNFMMKSEPDSEEIMKRVADLLLEMSLARQGIAEMLASVYPHNVADNGDVLKQLEYYAGFGAPNFMASILHGFNQEPAV